MQGFPGASLAGSAPESVPAMEPDNPEITKVATESSTSSWKLPNIHSFAGPLGVNFNLFTQVDGATFHHDASGEFNDDVVLRRLRLTFQRTLIRHWTFKGSAELNAGDFELKDLYGLYTGFPHASIFAGNQKEPFSLEQMTSSRFTTLMERSMSNTFSPTRSLGVSRAYQNQPQLRPSRGCLPVVCSRTISRRAVWELTGRLTHQPIRIERGTLHTGVSASFRNLGSSGPRFHSRPESGATDIRMVETDTIDNARFLSRLGLEAAYVDGPGSVHGEYIASRVDRDDGLSTLSFHGGYVQAAWFLTGESLPYLADTGVLGRLRPKSRFTLKNPTGGAWELAVRLSRIDLNDDDIIGGEELNLTLGVTWYLDKYTKVMANYVDVIDVDRPGSEFDGNDLNIFQLRFQIEF